MAEKVSVELIDDIDGSEADESVVFSLDGVDYEIDLSAKNAAELRDSLGQFIEHARRTGGRKQPGKAARQAPKQAAKETGDREENRAIREWAREQGYDVSDRGRIPAEIIDAYHQAS
ncbi:Lsr2 family protein [Haloechinothrix salitolerans]|uniref:Lsr2 family protein n=1 Tax=Haloechinothrix salitolerans TaxID=926830 RepID=A0ABW2C221_9PSEU